MFWVRQVMFVMLMGLAACNQDPVETGDTGQDPDSDTVVVGDAQCAGMDDGIACELDDPCVVDAACSAGFCIGTPAADGDLCDADGDWCTVGDTCNGTGACVSGENACTCETLCNKTTFISEM